jgi:hypothetical protein
MARRTEPRLPNRVALMYKSTVGASKTGVRISSGASFHATPPLDGVADPPMHADVPGDIALAIGERNPPSSW